MPFWGLNIVSCHYGFHCLSLSFSVLPLTNIYLFLSQFCHLMTRVVLLFEGADGSLVSHILRKKRGGWDTGGRAQDKQCCRPPIWMKTTSIRTAFHGQHKAYEAASYMPWLYVTVYVYTLQESFIKKELLHCCPSQKHFYSAHQCQGLAPSCSRTI